MINIYFQQCQLSKVHVSKSWIQLVQLSPRKDIGSIIVANKKPISVSLVSILLISFYTESISET